MNYNDKLKIDGTKNYINWKDSNAILLNSAVLIHGTHNYIDDTNNCLMDIFII